MIGRFRKWIRPRLIEKQIPGKAPEYYIYNKADQIILYQDGNMRKVVEGKNCYSWQFTKYDGLGRVIMTGITDQFPVESRDDIQALANHQNQCFETLQYATMYPQSNSNYYTNNAFPTIGGDEKLLTLNYYDTYVINTSLGIKPIISESNMIFDTLDASFKLLEYELNFTSGLQTIQYVEYNGTLWPTVSYYDTRGRLLQERSVNHKKGLEINNVSYKDLTNLITTTEHKHSTDIYGRRYEQTEKYTFNYSAEGRLLSRSYYLKGVLVQELVFDYTPMGDQVIKKVYKEGSTVRQTVDYKFNIRGWLTRINDPANFPSTDNDYFSMQLYYDKAVNSSMPRYNGNISFMKWQTVPPTGSTNIEIAGIKGYDLRYDNLNRLKIANYFSVEDGKFEGTSKYTEGLTYDKNGNIKTLNRYGFIQYKAMADPIDELTYSYAGNQLIAVDDRVQYNNITDFYDHGHYYNTSGNPEYRYDANGNLTQDVNKEILNISYNELNLPITIDFPGNYKIEYKYDALGNKKCQMVSDGGRLHKTIDFIGNFVYENNYPAYHTFDEGRIVYKPETTYYTETYLKDHLGNIRVAFGNDGSGYGVKQTNTYYPFGMEIFTLSDNSTTTTKKNEYKYNGKMFQDELGLDWYDYGARFYDAQIGRWHSVDLLAERHQDYSPYVYVLNNPITNVDIYGYTDWNTILKGAATFTAGLAGTVVGASAAFTPTGVGQIGGAVLISAGIPSMGCGIGMIVDGFVHDGKTNLPGGLLEATGMVVGKAVGDESIIYRNIGSIGDISTNFVAGIPETAVEKVAIGILTIDAARNIVNSGNNATQTNSESANIENITTAVSDNTKFVTNAPVVNMENVKIDEQYLNDFFGDK